MKFNEKWLREWVNPLHSTQELGTCFTSVGLEIESITSHNGDDSIFEIAVSPNRGDCLSLLGVAREVSLFSNVKYQYPVFSGKEGKASVLPVVIREKSLCPVYAGQVIQNIDSNALTPDWIKNRLEAVGQKLISPVVDILNYVMFELGQPMHAFDCDKLKGSVEVRLGKKGESISLLDGTNLLLDENMLVIADQKGPQALAGIMGGMASGVFTETKNLFLESAFFDPIIVRKTSRGLGILSESSYRFERGVDPFLQRRALERASQLILDCLGGTPSPIQEIRCDEHIQKNQAVLLRRAQIKKVLGIVVEDDIVEGILTNLETSWTKHQAGWMATAPSFRFDLNVEVDYIEEIARIYGLDKIPSHKPIVKLIHENVNPTFLLIEKLKAALVHRGYFESISYSFLDPTLLQLFDLISQPLTLLNPISSELSTLRTNLWPSLAKSIQYNVRRQNDRVRLFEVGNSYHEGKGSFSREVLTIAGICTGPYDMEQWGIQTREVDFFDLKGDVEALLKTVLGHRSKIMFSEVEHPSLHPKQSALIKWEEKELGFLGMLHPRITQALELSSPLYAFELQIEPLKEPAVLYREISKFPWIRRDISIIVDQRILSGDLKEAILNTRSIFLKNVVIFDVYQGKSLEEGKKSIGLGLIFQENSRTLTDLEVNESTNIIAQFLRDQFQAVLRDS